MHHNMYVRTGVYLGLVLEMNFDQTLCNHPAVVYCNADIERIVVGLFECCVYI